MYLSSRILSFSDFNCVYCYALNTWLEEFELQNHVKWVGVQYHPAILEQKCTPQVFEEYLDKHLGRVMRFAPEVPVLPPTQWIDTSFAMAVQGAIEDDFPDKAPALRSLLFQQLWLHHKNISSKEVLDECLKTLQLPALEALYVDDKIISQQSNWWLGELGQLPSLIAPTGARQLGLQRKHEVKNFILGALLESPEGHSC
jgi:predicted DsbA family dithiol-disulfide isomerase